MKKIVSLLLALCLACMMLPALAEEGSPLGTWYLVRGEKDGAVVETAGMMTMELNVNEDGSVSMKISMYGQDMEQAGTWEAVDGGIAVTDAEGTTQTLAYTADELYMDQDGTKLIFSRTAPEAPDTSVAEKVPAESVEQFDGSWIMSKVIVLGMVASPGDIGVDDIATLTIKDGKIVETAMAEGEKVQNELQCEFVDGFIKVSISAGDEVALEVTYALLEDGTLGGFMDIMGMEATMIYEKVGAAEEEPAA